MRPRFIFEACLVFLCACGGGIHAADAPVAANEPRETTLVLIDLKKTATCTEAFDLAVYENRNIEMIAWKDDEGSPHTSTSAPDCEHRIAEVRFLSRHISKADVLSLLRSHATRVTESTRKGK